MSGVAGAGPQHLAVRPEHVADLHVHDLDVVGQPAGLAGGGPDHLEVQRLRRADDVEDAVGVQVADPVPDRGQVGGRVAVAAVGLADDQRQRLALAAGEAVEEHAQRAVADRRDARSPRARRRCRPARRCSRLAGQVGVGQGDAERR